jgi:hypothetical protein
MGGGGVPVSHQCHHIKPSGERCQALALRGDQLCYFHSNLNRVEKTRGACATPHFASIEDLRGVQLALMQVIDLLNNPYADQRHARQMLYALQIAAQLATRIDAKQHKHATCTHCGKTAAELPEPPDVDTTDLYDFLPNRIRLYPEPAIIESAALPVSPQGQLPASLPPVAGPDQDAS